MFNEPARPRVIYENNKFRIVVRKPRHDRDLHRIYDVESKHTDSLGAPRWQQELCISGPVFESGDPNPHQLFEDSEVRSYRNLVALLLDGISSNRLFVQRGTLVQDSQARRLHITRIVDEILAEHVNALNSMRLAALRDELVEALVTPFPDDVTGTTEA